MRAETEEFAAGHGIDYQTVHDVMTDYVFNGNISDEAIRQKLVPYHLGLLKTTVLMRETKTFVEETYLKYKAEGE